jgi:hypothetical protein
LERNTEKPGKEIQSYDIKNKYKYTSSSGS